jgi:hypothetical protein
MASFGKAHRLAALSLLGALMFFPSSSGAQDSELESLRSMIKTMQQDLQKALSRIEQLENEKTAGAAKLEQVEKSIKTVQSTPSILNPAIGLAIDASAEHRDKSGGDFNLRAAELGISASIDPYARAYAFIMQTGTRSSWRRRRSLRLRCPGTCKPGLGGSSPTSAV